MISARAREGFEQILGNAIRTSLSAPHAGPCTVVPIVQLATRAGAQTAMLTVSSCLFRAIVFLHFVPDAATGLHFARRQGIEDTPLGGQALLDAICESGNLCCGILNRELGHAFPHLGMSTPNILAGDCMAGLERLAPGHVAHFRVDPGDGALFQVSLYVSAGAALDFCVQPDEAASDTGELELF